MNRFRSLSKVTCSVVVSGCMVVAGCSARPVEETSQYRLLASKLETASSELDTVRDRLDERSLEVESFRQRLSKASMSATRLAADQRATQARLDDALAEADRQAAAAAEAHDAFIEYGVASLVAAGVFDHDQAACISEALIGDAEVRHAFILIAQQGKESTEAFVAASAIVTPLFWKCGVDLPSIAGPAGVPWSYGDNAELDALHDSCSAGEGSACDELYITTTPGSEYNTFGGTCGGRYESIELAPENCVDAT